MRDISFIMDRGRMSKFDTSSFPGRKEELRYWLSTVQFEEDGSSGEANAENTLNWYSVQQGLIIGQLMEDFDPHCIVEIGGALCGDPECLPRSPNIVYRIRQLAQSRCERLRRDAQLLR